MKQLVKLQEDLEAFKKQGVQVIAISQDNPSQLTAMRKKNKLDMTLFSDGKMQAAKDFGLAFSVNQKTVGQLKKYGIDLVALYGRTEPLLVVPSVFLINDQGKIVFNYVNPDYSIRLESDTLKAMVKGHLLTKKQAE